MSELKPRKSIEKKMPKAFGWMAEYQDENSLLAAARKVRDSGYTKTDAFTPFPVHGIDEALGIKPTIAIYRVVCRLYGFGYGAVDAVVDERLRLQVHHFGKAIWDNSRFHSRCF